MTVQAVGHTARAGVTVWVRRHEQVVRDREYTAGGHEVECWSEPRMLASKSKGNKRSVFFFVYTNI